MTTAAKVRVTSVHRDLLASRVSWRPVESDVPKAARPAKSKKPGSFQEWKTLVNQLADAVKSLARGSRSLSRANKELEELSVGDWGFADRDRERSMFTKRCQRGCEDLVRMFLEANISPVIIGQFLELIGTRNDRKPDYQLGLLHSKLLGLEFVEERTIERTNEEGEVSVSRETLKINAIDPEKPTARKAYKWSERIRAETVEDFTKTMRHLDEEISELQSAFSRPGFTVDPKTFP